MRPTALSVGRRDDHPPAAGHDLLPAADRARAGPTSRRTRRSSGRPAGAASPARRAASMRTHRRGAVARSSSPRIAMTCTPSASCSRISNGWLAGVAVRLDASRRHCSPSVASAPMSLASLDGLIGPAEEARIPVTDEGLLRGDGAFEVMRLYGGRPFALARPPRPPAALRRGPAARGRPRRARGRDRRAARGERRRPTRCCASSSPAAAGGSRSSSRCPARPPIARVATITFAPGRILDGLKTLSYAGNMLAGPARQGARLRRGAVRPRRTAACSRARRGRSSGSRAASSSRRRSRTASSPRSRARGCSRSATSRSARARSTTSAPPRRRSSPRPCAR